MTSSLRQTPWPVAALMVFALAAAGQQDKPGPDEKPPPDPKFAEKLTTAREHLKDNDWDRALPVLQALLDSAEDALAEAERPGPDGKAVKAAASVREEASRLLDRMPAKVREEYQKTNGPQARDLFDRAVRTADTVAVAEIARRFLHTDAGEDALEWLALRDARRGDHAVASARFTRLWQRREPKKATELILFHAARSLLHGGDADGFDRAWSALKEKVGDGPFASGGETRTLALWADHLRKEAEQPPRPKPNPALFGGGPARTGTADASAPLSEELWGPDPRREHLNTVGRSVAKATIDQALKAYEARGGVVISAASPIASGGRLVFRTTGGVYTVEPKDARALWNNYDSTRLSFDRVSSQGQYWVQVQQWCAGFSSVGRPNIIFENSTVGGLSADEARVYCVDDLPVPPFTRPDGDPKQMFGRLQEEVKGNRLQAYALTHGKLVWELGHRSSRKDDFDLAETYFLGAPLPMDGKLHVLVERQGRFQLLALDPETGKVLWHLPLTTPATPMLNDPVRRAIAVHLAHAEGVLVAPTHAGSVLGIDLTARTVLWVHDYAAGRGTEWKSPGVVVHAGRVLVTGRGGDLTCLRLADGRPLWKAAKQDDDLYLAGVVGDRVLVVGRKECRAVALKDGKDVWRVATGTPSGLGAAGGDFYYLPLKSGATTGRPEVCVIDAFKGQVQSRVAWRKNNVPGNLLFVEGLMVSQSLDRVAAYPLLADRLKEIDELLKKNPNDPRGLTERGALRLHRGDLPGAAEDLKAALAGKPDRDLERRAGNLLFEAGLELLRRDFDKGEQHLDELTRFSAVEEAKEMTAEQKAAARADGARRKTHLLLAVGAGREKQGKPVEALKAYLDLGLLGDDVGPVASPDDPGLKATPSTLAAGRIKSLFGSVKEADRKKLEEELERRWKEIRDGKDLEKKNLFLRLVGGASPAGTDKALAVAAELAAAGRFREAELLLLPAQRQRERPELAAGAAEQLALASTAEGDLEDAAFLYRRLAAEFADVVVRDGKKGKDLFAAIQADKRLLPFLEEARPRTLKKLDVKEQRGSFNPGSRPDGLMPIPPDVLPSVRPWQGGIGTGGTGLWLAKGNAIVQVELPPETRRFFAQSAALGKPLILDAQALGRTLVVTAGPVVCAIDLSGRKLLWQQSRVGESAFGPGGLLMPGPDGDGLVIVANDGRALKISTTTVAQPHGVFLTTDQGLLAVRPTTGERLWQRDDVPSGALLVGDGDHLLTVEPGPERAAPRCRVFRAADGNEVKVNDLGALWARRLGGAGVRVLHSDADAQGKPQVRLHDVVTGKDVWKTAVADKALVARSYAGGLDAVVEPDGTVIVIDAAAGKEAATFKVAADHVAKAESVALADDGQFLYLALNEPPNPDRKADHRPGAGAMSVPVNGWLYSVRRDTGAVAWRAETRDQFLVLDHFRDQPFVLLASLRVPRKDQADPVTITTAVRALDRATGKLLFDAPELKDAGVRLRITLDPGSGKLELTGFAVKVTITPVLE